MSGASRALASAALCALLGCSSVPGQPQQLTALVADGQVQLTWVAVDAAEQYLVYRGSSKDGAFSELARTSVAGFVDKSALFGEVYYYRVRALGTAGPGGISAPAKAAITPGPPTGLVAKVTPAGVSLSWEPAPGATLGYQIATSVSGAPPIPVGQTPATRFVDPSPPPGNATYLVTGINPAGEGAAAGATVLTVPAAPQLTAVGGSGEVTLSWAPVQGAVTYLVSRDGSPLFYVTGTTYLDSGLALLSSYSYSVQSFNEAGAGGAATASVRTGPAALPYVQAAASDTEVILTWPSVPGADGYLVLRAELLSGVPGPLVPIGGPLTQQFLVDQVPDAQAVYTYQVFATEGGATSSPATVQVFSLGIAVTSTTAFVTDTGTLVMPDDLSGANALAVSAIVAGIQGGTTGLGVPSGDLVIAGVSQPGYFLRLGNPGFRYYDTTQRTVNLAKAVAGRPHLQRALTSPTNLTLSLTGLDAWSSNDSLELFSYGADDAIRGLEQAGSTQPAPGASALNTTIDLARCCNLIDTAQGDQVWLLQLVGAVSSNGLPYSSLKALSLLSGPLTLVDGGSGTLTGTLVEPGQQSLSLFYDRASYKAFAPQVSPAAVSGVDALDLQAAPGYAQHGSFTGGADLVTLLTNTSTDSLAVGNVLYAPPPASWDVYLSVQSTFLVPVLAPGATNPRNVPASLTHTDLLGNFGQQPTSLSVTLSPPLSPTINGTGAFVAHVGTGLAPVFAWSAPSVGVASSYSLSINQLINSNGDTVSSPVAELFTQNKSLQVPVGLLTAGSTYFAVLRARADGVPIGLTPLVLSPGVATADLVTATFQP